MNGAVSTISVTQGGSGYQAPTVSITGGSGSGAAAAPVISNGGISGFIITDAGTGYTPAGLPTVTITGGGGSGATASILAADLTKTGAVQNITLNSPGTNYFGPQVAIDAPSGLPKVFLNEQELTYANSGSRAGQWLNASNQPAQMQGNIGTNAYVVRVVDGNTIFTNILSLKLTGTASSFSVDTPPTGLFGNEVPLTLPAPVGGPYTPAQFQNGVGIPFTPKPVKDFYGIVQLPGVSYATWLTQYPGLIDTSPMGNPDHDFHVNLLEYFFDGNPTVVDLLDVPMTVYEANQAGDDLLFSYRVSKDIEGVVDEVQWSTDLVTWHSSDVSFDPDQDFVDYIERTARVPVNGGDTKLFIRLRVTQQP